MCIDNYVWITIMILCGCAMCVDLGGRVLMCMDKCG